jgi:hypothetical protein
LEKATLPNLSRDLRKIWYDLWKLLNVWKRWRTLTRGWWENRKIATLPILRYSIWDFSKRFHSWPIRPNSHRAPQKSKFAIRIFIPENSVAQRNPRKKKQKSIKSADLRWNQLLKRKNRQHRTIVALCSLTLSHTRAQRSNTLKCVQTNLKSKPFNKEALKLAAELGKMWE